jgi:hypothetical protein
MRLLATTYSFGQAAGPGRHVVVRGDKIKVTERCGGVNQRGC